jgi:short-subunit dehydrogenase
MDLTPIDYAKGAALVTGGTSGIGKEIARELVRRGVEKIVIVAQDQEKLDRAATELRGLNPDLEVHTIAIDLSQHGAAGEIRKNVDAVGWAVEILVNNAGLARKYVFAEDPTNDPSLKMIDVMARALVDMSLHFLPDMVKRRRGGILNLGSTAGYAAVPYTSAYAASKAFVISFSQAIREENRDNGVRIACIVPGVTQTNLDGERHGERRGVLDLVGIDDPADVAKGAVEVFEANDPAKIFGWNNKILQLAQDLLPTSVNAHLIAKSRGAPGEE